MLQTMDSSTPGHIPLLRSLRNSLYTGAINILSLRDFNEISLKEFATRIAYRRV
jgi:hypothetical protein